MSSCARMLISNSCIRYTNRTRPQISHLFRSCTRYASTNSRAVRNATPPPLESKMLPRVDSPTSQGQYSKDKLTERLFAENQTILYNAPRRITYFRIQCWTIVGLGMSFIYWYTGEKIYDIDRLRQQGIELARLTQIGEFATAALVALGVGTALYRTTNHVQTVKLVKEMDKVFVRISWRHVIPFVQSHVAVRPQNLAISKRLVMPRTPPSSLSLRKLNESSVSALIVSVMGNTVRAFPLLIWHFVDEIRRFFTNEGLVKMRILGEDAKLKSATGGYLLLDVDGKWAINEFSEKKETLALLDVCREDQF